jgi:hypothetical protein
VPEVKVLLLGCGDSGKSTFFRQIEFLFARGAEAESPDLSIYRPLVREQLLANLALLLRIMRDTLRTAPPAGAAERATANQVLALVAAHDRLVLEAASGGGGNDDGGAVVEPLAETLTPVLGVAIARLWLDQRVQAGYQAACRSTYEESLASFFPEAERIA